MAIHFHAQERMKERGVTENEVKATIEHGEPFPAKFQRTVSDAIFLLTACGAASIIRPNR